MIKKTHELKQLQSQKAKLEVQANILFKEKKEICESYSKIIKKIEGIAARIADLVSDNVVITEHALLRYLERLYDIDLTEIENQILDEKTMSQIQMLENGTFPIINNLKAVVKNKTIVSIIK